MKLSKNIILSADSYKYSMPLEYPTNTEYVYSYIESRGGQWDATVFFGLQAYIKEYLTTPITQEDIDIAEEIITAHGEPFYREGWQHILDNHGGKLPVVIKAAPEGCIIPTKNVLVTVENTDPKCWWLTTFLETSLLRAVWYPTTVATNSYEYKKIILNYLEKTGDPAGIDWKLQDFGNRGVSSMESAGLGGTGHLINFNGTDTVTAVLYAREYYNAGIAGFSIPASEHSISSSYGKDNERAYIKRMIELFGTGGKMFALVGDTYNIYNFCDILGVDPEIKAAIIANGELGGITVVRPDSGVPSEVVVKCLYILDKHFGSVKNAKGYRVLNNVRIIQGDGIDHATVRSILFCMEMAGFSADNITFGCGGKLLQAVDRDTMKFAMKASSTGIKTNGELVWNDVFKDPITDHGKESKKGRVTLMKDSKGEYYSGVEDWMTPMLQEVYRDGALVKEYTFAEVRANARK